MNAPTCPKCGGELPVGVPLVLCPKCLLAEGVEGAETLSVSGDATLAVPAANVVLAPGQLPFRSIGDYELIDEIARGGMGVVFKARQVRLKRTVAIKMIHGGALASPQAVQRFNTEAEAAAKLDHPHIVPIYEIGQHEGHHYFSMKLLEGGSLAQELRQPGQSRLAFASPVKSSADQRQAAGFIAKVARAVHYAHQRGVLHRDIKPGNIMLDAQSEPHVTDFGLAKLLERDSSVTLTEAVLGSPGYMAPEQASGHSRQATTAVDIYSLGVVLFELLTGRLPFRCPTALETMRAIVEQEPPRPSALNPAVDADLETICLKCLEKEPAKRYATAEGLVQDLERFLNDEPIQARPVGVTEKAWRWCRRKPALAGMAATLVLALAVGSTVVVWLAASRKKELIDTRRLLYARNMIVVHQDLENGNYQKAQDLLKNHLPKPGVEELRGFEWRYLWQLSQGEQLSVLGRCTSAILSVAVSPDGKFVASANEGSAAVKVWDLPAHREIQTLTNHTAPVHCVVFSPDGKTLASGSDDHTIKLWDTRTWRRKASLDRHTKAVITVAFSGDGRTMASSSDDLSVIVWDTATGRERTTLTNVTKLGGPMALSANGGTLFVGDSSAIKVWDVGKREWKHELTSGESWPINTIVLSPDERTLAAGHGSGVLTLVWDLAKQNEEHPAPKRLERTTRPAFSPDSRRLAVGTSDNGRIELWDLQTWTRQSTLRGHTPSIKSIVFSSDGKTVISGAQDKSIRIWTAGAQKERDVFRDHTNNVSSVAFSPDNHTLASGSSDGTVLVWDTRTGQLNEALRNFSFGYCLTISPDGKLLASVGSEHDSPNAPHVVRLWNLDERREIAAFKAHDGSAKFVTFAPDGRTLATTGQEGTIKLWDASTQLELASLKGHSNEVYLVAFSHDGAMLASVGQDKTRL